VIYQNYNPTTTEGIVMTKELLQQADEAIKAFQEVLRISDRKHNAWDEAKESIGVIKALSTRVREQEEIFSNIEEELDKIDDHGSVLWTHQMRSFLPKPIQEHKELTNGDGAD